MIYNKKKLEKLKIDQQKNGPKYTVLDNLFDSDFIKKCESEFFSIPDDDFIRYSNPLFEFEKYALNNSDKIPENLKNLFDIIHSRDFIDSISKITGGMDLKTDGKRWGGGLHQTKFGGYLSIHKDFNILPTSYTDEKQMLRCINVIGYMNSNWKKGDGGELEFWNESGGGIVEKVEPIFNRWVIFDTRGNFHGHPYPYLGSTPRISIASYYYIEEAIEESKWISTEYLRLPWMEDSEDYKKQREERANPRLRYKNLLK